MSFAFSQMTCDKLHEPLKDGTTYTCPFCYAAKAHAKLKAMEAAIQSTALARVGNEYCWCWPDSDEPRHSRMCRILRAALKENE